MYARTRNRKLSNYKRLLNVEHGFIQKAASFYKKKKKKSEKYHVFNFLENLNLNLKKLKKTDNYFIIP